MPACSRAVLRAALFVVVVWLIIATVVALFAVVEISEPGSTAAEKAHASVPPSKSELPPGSSANASVLAELKDINSNLVTIKGLLEKQEQRSGAPEQAHSNLAGIEDLLSTQEATLDAIKNRLGAQEPIVGAIKDALMGQEQRLGALDRIEPSIAGIKSALSTQSQRLGALIKFGTSFERGIRTRTYPLIPRSHRSSSARGRRTVPWRRY